MSAFYEHATLLALALGRAALADAEADPQRATYRAELRQAARELLALPPPPTGFVAAQMRQLARQVAAAEAV